MGQWLSNVMQGVGNAADATKTAMGPAGEAAKNYTVEMGGKMPTASGGGAGAARMAAVKAGTTAEAGLGGSQQFLRDVFSGAAGEGSGMAGQYMGGGGGPAASVSAPGPLDQMVGAAMDSKGYGGLYDSMGGRGGKWDTRSVIESLMGGGGGATRQAAPQQNPRDEGWDAFGQRMNAVYGQNPGPGGIEGMLASRGQVPGYMRRG